VKLWKRLDQRHKARSKIEESTPDKKKPHSMLTTPEVQRRLKRASKEVDSLKRKNERLKQRIGDLVRKEGVQVPEDMSNDFKKILQNEEAIQNLNPFQKVLIEEQLKAASVKSAYAMRWHPLTIRIALSFHQACPNAYETLSGVLRLPSQQTLFNYSHILHGTGIDINHLFQNWDSLGLGEEVVRSQDEMVTDDDENFGVLLGE